MTMEDTPFDLDARARAILRVNDRGGYTVPTRGLYPFQWNWDSAFAAWGFATFDGSRAWTELETLMTGQWDDGMVPHILFHRPDPGYFPGPEVWASGTMPASSGITQPPVAATMARLVHDRSPDEGRLAALYPRLLSWHRWFMIHRVRQGVACVTHPWESGRDNCPDWDIGLAAVDGSGVAPYQRRDTGHVDASMRPTRQEYDRYVALVEFGRDVGWDQSRIVDDGPFLMADPGTHFILMRAHSDLAALGRALGRDVAEIEAWMPILAGGCDVIWNDALGAYDARDMRSGRFAGTLGTGAMLAFLAGQGRPPLTAHLDRIWDAVRYGLPSSDPEGPGFDARRYWRGPAWPFLNALIAMGLDGSRAERLRSDTAALIRGGGFNEYFDPTDGTACGGGDFTWTAAIWLTWARGAD
ncbi:hypothetical protein MWU52_11090 [Jannaschia sp. S6380]|uniref:MGH1-like glycoside hydrolase domain-containing protein n=1 Tax=Jannaschia sp. S6380 TaxID=2926408 RepID=UPI001FF6154C|nr:hypothetical protein [Jannaschia sp. S6380]MCK0168098.1 hypothetical protein [Jannaschia sp. S6380]